MNEKCADVVHIVGRLQLQSRGSFVTFCQSSVGYVPKAGLAAQNPKCYKFESNYVHSACPVSQNFGG
jgi:hypothetical protein